jgi:hypothetical protein
MPVIQYSVGRESKPISTWAVKGQLHDSAVLPGKLLQMAATIAKACSCCHSAPVTKSVAGASKTGCMSKTVSQL